MNTEKRFSVSIPPPLEKAVEDTCKKFGYSHSEFTREALWDRIKKLNPEAAPA
jgi:metal-responsive CopG/Arc/MetJ family transcriptional regulator